MTELLTDPAAQKPPAQTRGAGWLSAGPCEALPLPADLQHGGGASTPVERVHQPAIMSQRVSNALGRVALRIADAPNALSGSPLHSRVTRSDHSDHTLSSGRIDGDCETFCTCSQVRSIQTVGASPSGRVAAVPLHLVATFVLCRDS